jgi:hypothetical protein
MNPLGQGLLNAVTRQPAVATNEPGFANWVDTAVWLIPEIRQSWSQAGRNSMRPLSPATTFVRSVLSLPGEVQLT